MPQGKFHQVWIEQCEAAQTIRARFGLKAAFDYLATMGTSRESYHGLSPR